MKRKIGFSTGIFYKSSAFYSFETILMRLLKLGCTAIEVNSINPNMLEKILHYSKFLQEFEFVGLHAPASKFKYKDNEETIDVLNKIRRINNKVKFDNIVLHPTNVEDWNVFQKYKELPFSIENMDNRKGSYKTIEEIRKIIENYNFQLTLDIQHIFSNDAEMKNLNEFFYYFTDNIKCIHISGFKDDYHFPIYKTTQNGILNSVPNKPVAIIIESVLQNWDELKKELYYIQNKLIKKSKYAKN